MVLTDLHSVIPRYRETLYPMAWHLTRNDADAHDLVQETLVRALVQRDQLRSSESVLAWLRMILRRSFLNWYKRKKLSISGRTKSLENLALEWGYVSDAASRPERITLHRIEAALIREAIDNLRDSYRDCVILSDIEGYSYAEIAERLDLSLVTVKSRLHRGRVRVREALRKQGFE